MESIKKEEWNDSFVIDGMEERSWMWAARFIKKVNFTFFNYAIVGYDWFAHPTSSLFLFHQSLILVFIY